MFQHRTMSKVNYSLELMILPVSTKARFLAGGELQLQTANYKSSHVISNLSITEFWNNDE